MELGELIRKVTLGKPIRDLWRRAPAFHAGTILVAESDESLRCQLAERLQLADYRTLEAANGNEAVRIAVSRPRDEIRLLLTDVTLPELPGWDLGAILRLDHPRLKVVCFGRNPQESWSRPRSIPTSFFLLPKPFSSEPVLRAVRRELVGARA